ncbi:propionyl-CoA carboxylase [Streptomyces viridochromogenes DSM 40736]|uniref:Propionyl-CoA carboxylase n=1 Tax=Streptomyces viridochromogenes (strain DSM 40736 / JCM 4977 / BCRC 1201 / Tue 494) TaxID=591159 RepID=D9X435_STRVT|nr:carboxyl transferase domain-containing protein [Streptomyces viridochromogenes]EFL35863.1 propionyl-CoA carboxylase [Streptomyces viridochromogenes DSM 40736]
MTEVGTDLSSARELVELLLDEGSLTESDAVAHRHPDNVVGYGTVDGRPVCVASGPKIPKALEFALKTGCPLISVVGSDTGGGAVGLPGEIFRRAVLASGVVPQIALIVGHAGHAAPSPAVSDFVVTSDQASYMFATGPVEVEDVTEELLGPEELAGARALSTESAIAHHMADDEKAAVEYVRTLLSYLPSNNLEEPPADPWSLTEDVEAELRPLLDSVVPPTLHQPYDMLQVVENALDDDEFLETQALFAPAVITGFGRVEGHPVGIVANQPLRHGGCLDTDTCDKAARFIRTCDAFNVPVLTFVDVPGFRPGTDQERSGTVRHGAKLAYAYAEATVPLLTVITREARGGAYDVMGSKHLGADLNLAWPTARITVPGTRLAPQDTRLDSDSALESGYVDAVITPSLTRQHLIRGLRALRTKRETQPGKKHGNIPL